MSKTLADRRMYHLVFCTQLFGFFPLGLCGWQPRNRQIHRQVWWKHHRISGVVGKQRNIVLFGFLGYVEPKWCRKYQKCLCCEIFVTKSKLMASLAVWRNLLPYIFQGGLQPVLTSRPWVFPFFNSLALWNLGRGSKTKTMMWLQFGNLVLRES